MKALKRIATCAPLALAGAAGTAWATNGMNMEGYGPVSTGMGGASQAIDHGTAALAQNPATLALMSGVSRLDVAVGQLGPRVKSSAPGAPDAESDGTSYIMPAIGFARRSGAFTFGFGVFAQGGMGTEYGENSFLARPTGLATGAPVRSELGVGRVMFPLAFQVTPEFAVGATLDYMWAGLDLRMAAPASQLGQLVTGASGPLGAGLQAALPTLPANAWARIDFSNSNDFTGAAKSTGWAGKIGAVYRPNAAWTVGASYQMKSSLGDMETGATGASLTVSAFPQADIGRMTVVDFQWPSMTAVGAAWQATPALLLAADLKSIGWGSVMKDFKMRYDSATMGGSVSFALPQNWKDQTVVNLGAAWRATDALTLRAGLNLADNPIPDETVNPLFPATVKNHFTAGVGYQFNPVSEFNGSLTVTPTSTVTNGQGITISHRQLSLQAMYTHRF